MTSTTSQGTTQDAGGEEPAALVELHEHVLLRTLNRPRAMNAVSAAMTMIVADALERAESTAFAEKRTPVWQGR